MPKIANVHQIRAHEVAEDRTKTRAQKLGTVGVSVLGGLEHVYPVTAPVQIPAQALVRDIYERLDKVSSSDRSVRDLAKNYSLGLDLAPSAAPRRIRLDDRFFAEVLREVVGKGASNAPTQTPLTVEARRSQVLHLVLEERIRRLMSASGRVPPALSQSKSRPLPGQISETCQPSASSSLDQTSSLRAQSSTVEKSMLAIKNLEAARDDERKSGKSPRSSSLVPSAAFGSASADELVSLSGLSVAQSTPGKSGPEQQNQHKIKGSLASSGGQCSAVWCMGDKGVVLLSKELCAGSYGAKSMRYLQQMETGPPAPACSATGKLDEL